MVDGVFISIWFLLVYYSENLNARNEQNLIKQFFLPRKHLYSKKSIFPTLSSEYQRFNRGKR